MMEPDNTSSVPLIDLAPKLQRPLSLWNPLDYLRLLYWVFFFPQALRWYEETFSDKKSFGNSSSIRGRWQWIQENNTQRNLIIHGFVLIIIADFGGGKAMELLGLTMDWLSMSAFASLGMVFTVIASVDVGVAFGIALGLFGWIDLGLSMAWDASIGSAFGVTASIFLQRVNWHDIKDVTSITFIVLLVGLSKAITNLVPFMNGIVNGGLLSSLILGVAMGVITLRPENWLWGILFHFSNTYSFGSARISILPLPAVFKQSKGWLEQDWPRGLHNVNQLLAYTGQFVAVSRAINLVLAETATTDLLPRASQLATQPFDWDVVRYTSASLRDKLRADVIDGLWMLPESTNHRTAERLRLFPDLRLDQPYRAATAGFWYLHELEPAEASQSFTVLRDLPYGMELCLLAETLELCHQACSVDDPPALVATIDLPLIPDSPHLHPQSWIAIARLHHVIAALKIVKTSPSRSSRSLALNRAIGELEQLIQQAKTIITAEKDLILDIAQKWQSSLLTLSKEVGEIKILEPVAIPYTIGDPVEGDAFVGREDIIYQLSELWRSDRSVQSVVLYGHRRMGKTSILRNINRRLGDNVCLAYVNMLLTSAPNGAVDILIFICDEIQNVTDLPRPSNQDFNVSYENACRNYIQQVAKQLGNRKLIIAIDEFECIDNLITAQKITPDFLQFLRGLVQHSPNIAFAFAGLHTLEERVANYSDPFFASFIPIRVGPFALATTRELLANPPDPDFPLDYMPEVLDQIYALTAGQPYLTQLIGFQLVRHFNQQAFDEGHRRDPVFTLADLQTVVTDTTFFDRGRHYFTGVWGQAQQDVPHQQTILQALAPHPSGLSLPELSTTTHLDISSLTAALKVLDRHDVAHMENDQWRITIELFRRWVVGSFRSAI